MDDDILVSVPNGTAVEVKSKGGEWSVVRFGEYEGYMLTAYLNFEVEQTSGTAAKQMWVSTAEGSLNVRSTASGNSQIVTTIPRGTQVEVIAYGSEWSQIVWNGNTGFVMSCFLASEKPAESVQNKPAVSEEAATEKEEAE